MDKRKLKRYEILVYVLLLAVAIVLGFISNHIHQETIKAITVNLSSELLAVGILFFIINRVFLLDNSDAINNILGEVSEIKKILHTELDLKQKYQEQKISVVLQNGSQRLELPVELRRAEFTRAEILGRIGMIPMKEKRARFSIKYLSTSQFLCQINQVLATDTSYNSPILTLPCDEDEFHQFDLDTGNR